LQDLQGQWNKILECDLRPFDTDFTDRIVRVESINAGQNWSEPVDEALRDFGILKWPTSAV
jgi:hypothetical protein